MKHFLRILALLVAAVLLWGNGYMLGQNAVIKHLAVYEWQDDGSYPHLRRVSDPLKFCLFDGAKRYCAVDSRKWGGELR